MNNDMIERYIYAVVRGIPTKIRKDVSDELQSIISDMLEERCGEVLPTEKDIRVVLTELGKPSELAEKYNPDGKKCLIGPPYYTKYLYVLKIVLLATCLGICIASVLPAFIEPPIIWYESVLQGFGMLIAGITFAFAYVTVIFAIFYKKGIRLDMGTDSLDNLPPLPQSTSAIPKSGPIVEMVFTILFSILFLAAPQVISFKTESGWIPMFNVEVMRSLWYIIVLFMALDIIKAYIKMEEERYTHRVFVVTAYVNVADMLLACWWLMRGNLMNPEFVSSVPEIIEKNSDFLIKFFQNFQYSILVLMLLASIVDIIDTFVKSRKVAQ